MPSVSDLVDPAFRLFTVAEVTARYFALIFLVVGILGFFATKTNSRRSIRYRGMMVGAAAALVAILGMNAFYDLVAFIMGGTGFLPSGWPYGASGTSGLLPIAQAASGMLSYLGLACFSLGAALWAGGSRYGRTSTRGYRGVTWGLVMIGVSMGGTLFSAIAWIYGL
jgi:hypothetical protein